ncbi:uncharacterized protein TEOVI_000138800 [Trypanosoma equiperdum]|uniref:Uncharacterized protein n=2 Tax=Trypanozoon TaxID=39700 RepID=Q389E7_TRYB2|nr:hypothetical protein, conserved [Trypanosoma brucei brucei TREU927]EAN78573.1 hypothetical protein, conserved [Trypanosoma brucei brucei TREU927]SCU69819.1 hypothetical protein, conserved [Trypanosoma equiperdum]
MKRYIQHKESLPAQVGIKRYRTTAAEGATLASSTAHGGDTAELVDRGIESGVCHEHEESNGGNVQSVEKRTPSLEPTCADSDSSSENEDDYDELNKERLRLEQMQRDKKQTEDRKGSIGGSATGTFSPRSEKMGIAGNGNSAVGGVSSYNHDVLFRGGKWRDKNHEPAESESKKKKKEKWEAVVNDTQRSAAYQHFMKSYFK